MANPSFWAHQRVLLTGHTGFKGSWLSLWLDHLGAKTWGISLAPETNPNLYDIIQPLRNHTSFIADIRDPAAIRSVIAGSQPTIAIHMAAQALVRRSYRDPIDTFAANVMGTAQVLDALRDVPSLKAVVVVTTDKVYENAERGVPFVEDDALGGEDPYSASKAASEIAVSSWRQSYFEKSGAQIATARAGNVIGGGDWSEDRLIPDLWRAAKRGEAVSLRYPQSTRPWQHVLEPLSGYLMYAERLAERGGGRSVPWALNFGPSPKDELTVAEVAERFCSEVGLAHSWTLIPGDHPPEKRLLALNSAKAAEALGWTPKLTTPQSLSWTIEWYKAFNRGERMRDIAVAQIRDYENLRGSVSA